MAENDLRGVAFPRLTDTQVQEIEQCTGAETLRFRNGEYLFHVGQRDFPFYIVKSGRIEVIDETGNERRTVTVHEPGEFSGDVSHLTGNPAVVSAIAQGDCEVLGVAQADLSLVLNGCPDLADLILQAFIGRRQLLREPGNFTGLRVIGSSYSKDTFRIRDFLSRNRVMFTWLDLETDPDVDRLLRHFGVTAADTPIVICGKKMIQRNPSDRDLAERLGIRRPLEQTTYDLVIIGAGPAGLAAAVYGASEGLKTVILEQTAPGGQAGRSMRIENYLGFPTGITGSELIDRAVLQASKFGALLNVSSAVKSVQFDQSLAIVEIEGGETVVTRCLLIATGAEYRRLGVGDCDRFEGCGVYYAATPNEAHVCRDLDVIVVGGGNSAGQAAVYLATLAKQVYLVIRGDNLEKSMSSYLAQRIEQTENIELLCQTEVENLAGNGQLDTVRLRNLRTGTTRQVETPAVFSFIGAVPRTDWLPSEIETDAKGFVRTGPTLAHSAHWTIRRQPFLLETSRPGVFAAGDVRSGSVKRVASAVGEGSMVVQFVHEHLKQS